ncbi:MAG TPA: histidine phosphatase family protein [bacterium]|nr:histidine phosphatase family protein [bacterium]
MSRGTRIYLIRHGQTVWNAEGRFQGQTDSALSTLGYRQATCLSAVLAPLPIAAVYSSPLSRARLTAEAIADAHGLPVVEVADLREIGMGVWEGLTAAEITQRFGSVIEPRRRNPEWIAPQGGETLADVRARSMQAVLAIAGRHAGATVAVVAHGAVIKTVILTALDAPLTSYWRIRQENAAMNILDLGGDQPRVRVINETGHLSEIPPERSQGE